MKRGGRSQLMVTHSSEEATKVPGSLPVLCFPPVPWWRAESPNSLLGGPCPHFSPHSQRPETHQPHPHGSTVSFAGALWKWAPAPCSPREGWQVIMVWGTTINWDEVDGWGPGPAALPPALGPRDKASLLSTAKWENCFAPAFIYF